MAYLMVGDVRKIIEGIPDRMPVHLVFNDDVGALDTEEFFIQLESIKANLDGKDNAPVGLIVSVLTGEIDSEDDYDIEDDDFDDGLEELDLDELDEEELDLDEDEDAVGDIPFAAPEWHEGAPPDDIVF